MEKIGYSLVDAQCNEIQFWGDIAGQIQGAPDAIRLPVGDDVHCPEIGIDYGGFRLVERWLQYGDEVSTEFDGAKIVITRLMPAPYTVEEKLESVGLTIDDLKSALGI